MTTTRRHPLPAISIRLLTICAMLLGTQMATSAPASALEHYIRALVADDSVPACEQSAVTDTIRSKFLTLDDNVLKAGLQLGTIDKITQIHAGQNDPSPYARRYCEARATLSSGRKTRLYYLVEQDAGFVGISWNVDFCLEGLDPWHVHDGHCHTVRYRWW